MITKLRALILLTLLAFISSFSFAQGTIDFQTSYTGGSYLGSSNATFAAGSRTMKFNYNNATNNKFYIEDATGSGGYELAVLPVAADDKLTITDNTNPAFAFSFSSFFYRDNNGTGIHILIKGFRKGVQVGGTVDFDPGPGGTNSQLVDMLTLEPAFANVDMVEITSASAGVTEFFDNFVIANAGTITPGTAPTAVTTTYGTASAPASFTIAADALLGDLTLTPPAGFELSQTAGGASGYALSGTAITVTASGAGVSVTSLTIYVRLAATTAVGTYSGNIVASAAGASTVNIATTSSAVTAAPLTITTINVSKVYGVTIAGATSSTTFTATGLQNSETATTVDIAYGTGAAAADAAGTHAGAITMLNLAGGTFNASNYTIAYQPANITVTPAALSITASSTTKVYGVLLTGGSGSSAFTATGLQNGETISTVTIAYTSGFTATAPVGSYPAAITPSVPVGGGGFAASNYSITYNTAGVTVTAAPLTVTAIPGSKTYGTTFTTVTGSTSFGINGLQNLETALNVTITYSPTAGTATAAVGTYTNVTVPSGLSNGSFTASNYSITYVPANLFVTPAALTIAASNTTKTYGTLLSGGAGSAAFTSSGLKNSETISTVTLAYSSGNTATAATGGYSSVITPSVPVGGGGFAASNYSITYNTGDLTVTAAALSITASNTTKLYGVLLTGGSGSSAFTATGLQNGETISTVTIAYTSGFTATAPVGSYPAAITPSVPVGGGGFAASNYSITYNTAGVTVTAAPLTVTAIPGSKTYGTTFTTVTGSTSFGINGLQNLETALNVTITYSPTAGTATAAVGTYTNVTVPSGLSNGSFTASNYSITYVPANLFVTPAALAITASNTTKIYGTLLSGGAGSAAFTSSGLKNSETISTVTLAYSSGNTATAATGGYSSVITPSVPVGGGGFAASNYSITYNTGDLTVTAAALSITASNTTKLYGVLLTGGSGSTAFTVTGLQNSETISTVTIAYTSGFTATAAVGSYPAAITPSAAVGGGGFAASNYSITYNTAGVTVTAAPLTVTAIPGSKTYGTTFTTVTGSTSFGINGLQNLETALNVTITYSPTAGTATAAVGTYTNTIVPSGLTTGSFTASNYAITYVPANLFVTPAPLTVAATPVAKTYGNALSSVVINSAFTTTGLVNSETITQVTITYGTGRLATDGVNTYAGSVTPSAPTGTASASNYSITFVSTAITVTARPITITGGLNKPYGSTVTTGVSTFGFNITGLANGETISNTTTTYTAGNAAVDPVGTYAGAVTPSGAVGGSYNPANYTIAYVAGNVVVTPVTLTIIPAGINKIYGVTATGTAGYTQFTSTGLQNGDIIPSVTSSFAAGAPATAAVGVYTGTITLSAAIAGPGFTPTNYSIVYNPGPINVVPAPLTLTANDVTKSYGTAITGTAGSSAFTVTGLVNSETVSTITVAYGTGSAATAAVGSYSGTVTPSLPIGTATASNYSITYVTGAITVQTTPLTITANAVSKPYGTVLGTGTSAAFTSSGLKNSETIATVSMAISIPISGTAAVGTYPATITPSGAAGGSFTAGNYSITYVPAGITITTAPLTVTATDVVKTFGLTLTGSSGSTAFTATGLQNGEAIGTITIAYGTGAASNASAGSYPGSVTASAATGGTFTSTNYSIAYVAGAILIGNPATFATGTIGAMATTYGTASTGSTFAVSGTNIITGGILITPPTGFEVSSTSPTAGFAPTVTLGSTGNVSLTTIYIRLTATAVVGTYTGTVTVGTAGVTTLTLTVSGIISTAPLTITAIDASKVYGTILTGGTVATGFTTNGLKNLETILGVTITYATGAGNGNTLTDVIGTYTGKITASAPTGSFTPSNYSINFVNGNIIVTPSTNAKLSALVVSSGTFSPTFASTTNAYSMSVGNLVTAVTLTPTTDNAVATVTINGTPVTSGTVSASIPLNTGNNTITVLVTAQDGTTTNTYTITAFRERSTNANLSALAASATFTPVFASGTLAYTLSVANSVSSLALTPTVDNSAATVTVNGTATASGTGKSITLSVGSNTITTIVTAEDGVTTKTYVLTVTRAASSNANLSALAISAGTLSPVFASATTGYTVGVSNTVTTIALTPTVAEVTASVKVNGVSVTSGTSSGAIALSAGANTISIVVTAQDGTTNAYTITVTRDTKALSTNANLSALAISAGTLSPAFAGTTTGYSIIVSDNATSLTFTPTVAEVTASVKVSGISTVISGSNITVALPDDINTITIAVVAEDGTTIKNYVITVSKLRTAWKGSVTGGSWTELANWTNGVPDATKLAVIGQTNIAPQISGTVTAGSMNIASGVTVTITGNLQVTGNVVNAGTFSGTGVVTCTGTATQTFSGTGTINNLTINNPSRVSIAPGNGNTMSLAGVLTIANGVFSTGNNLVLLSNATTTASVAAMPLSTSIDGQVTVQRWISGQRGYRIFGHPFNGSLQLNQLTDNFAISGSGPGFVSGLGYGTASATYYDSSAATSATFQKPLSNAPNTASTPLWSVSRGIMIMIRGKGNEGLSGYTTDPTAFMADATGVLNQGALADYVLGTNATNTSFNLVGNPYAAPINIKLLKSNGGLASANTGIGNTIYVYNPFKNAGVAGSSPAQQVRGGLDAYTNDGSTDIIIPSFGGFFMQAKAAGNVLKFDESVKAVGSSPLAIMGNGDSKVSKLTLQVENSMGSWDDLKLRWENNGSSLGTDNYDGLKMNNELFDFYSIATDNRQLCIDSRSNSFSDQVIPLGIHTSVVDNTFRIKVTGYDMPSDVTVYLHDKLLNKEEILNAIGDGYAFALTADTATGGDNRFELVLKTAPKTTAVTTDPATSEDVRFMPNPFKETLIIRLGGNMVSSTGITHVKLMDANGRPVKSASYAPNTSLIQLNTGDLSTGIYFVEVSNDKNTIIKKAIKQ